MLSEVAKLIWGAGSTAYGVFSDKVKSKKIYRYVVPELHYALKTGRKINSPDVINAIKILEDLAPVGARRRNFNRRYLKNKAYLLSLPLDPDDLSVGFWW